jgi:hypothetical protein
MANKAIILQDVCEKCTCKEQEHFIDMTDFYTEDYREIIWHLKPLHIGWVDVTIMDLFNIPLATDRWIIDFIKARLHIDIETEKWVEEINKLFWQAKDFYEKRYVKSIPVKLKKITFKNTQSILNFIRETKTNKTTGSFHCALAKVAYAVDDVLSNEKVRREWFLDKQFIKEYLEIPLQITDRYEDKYGNIYRLWSCTVAWKGINFKIITRQKWSESIIGKQLGDAKYFSTDEFLDLVWSTIYVENDAEAALMMQYIDQMIYKWKAKIKNKNGLDLNAVKKEVYLNEEFYLKLEKETKETEDDEISEEEIEFNERKKSTAEKYKEIKLVGKVELSLEEWTKATKYPIGTEIKFVVGWHDNEEWISLQSIYDYAKRFRELTRLWIPIRKIDIVNYVNDFFENIDEILKKKNKEKSLYFAELFRDLFEQWCIERELKLNGNEQSNEKILAIWLFKYFESKLVKVKFPHSKKIYYFDEQMLKMRDAGLYKKVEQI